MQNILDLTTVLGFSLRLATAIVLGLIVGLERQWTRHQAGIMTNVIVCVGAYAYSAFSYIANQTNVDVTRIAAQVVCGIGFLGAGLIIRDGTNIRGLSTAATIWTTAAIGILCTLPNILFAVLVAIAIVILHLILHPLSIYINNRRSNQRTKERIENLYKISIVCSEDTEIDTRTHLLKTIREKNNVLLHNLESQPTDDGNVKIKAYLTAQQKNEDVIESIVGHVGREQGVISVGWKITE